tara:strand:+ start:662 stop:817 length:156 start_codon:yes stop_codon:yes gene_type:complete
MNKLRMNDTTSGETDRGMGARNSFKVGLDLVYVVLWRDGASEFKNPIFKHA